ncbi:peptidoglycan-associated lipoprotein Pal [Phenylobacterium sp.]|jgi:peptidoglycan-associated lipoprotein|uniref:peptidoglycan-associated lipoprotein Pal n=1 Tax=Phenylobacterium sp. TaxID=1871053 RepID=UPI002E30BB86|nr:peptidoglycan-associated lipoprotein Pal [Phenylobacterium sp.]HEX4712970.1 peptidoglycan-associated lipoprotein Pal [Phenylobacterium sp.]
MTFGASTLSRSVRQAAAAALLAGLAACASHPKPSPAAAPPPPPRAAARPTPAPQPAPVSSNPLPGTARDFVVNVGDRVYFDVDQYSVRSDAEPLLAAQASWLARYPSVQIRVEGNCDERGTQEYNLALGARRANSVKAFLVAHGVSSSRIATVSYGKEHPFDPGAGDLAWQHNRNALTDITGGARQP